MFVMVAVVVVLLHASLYMHMHALIGSGYGQGMVVHGSNHTFLEMHISQEAIYRLEYADVYRQLRSNTDHPKPTALARWYWIFLLMRRVPRT